MCAVVEYRNELNIFKSILMLCAIDTKCSDNVVDGIGICQGIRMPFFFLRNIFSLEHQLFDDKTFEKILILAFHRSKNCCV